LEISRNKTKMATAIALALLMATGTLMTLPVQAQTVYTNRQEGGGIHPLPAGVTPDASYDAFAFLSFRPTTIGLGQTFLVNLWVTPAIHASRYFKDFKVTITKADGTQDVITLDSYRADGTAWFEYIADQIGNWTLVFEFQGAYFPAGNYTIAAGAAMGSGTTSFPQSAWYKPNTSPTRTLVVQADMVASWPESALPEDYWTRPAHVENREWWPILGNWPGTGYVGGGAEWDEMYPDTSTMWNSRQKFTPWVQGPNSAHIVWKRQGNIAGLIGGQAGTYGITAAPGYPTIIYAGRCYQTVTKTASTLINGTYYDQPISVWQCYDLRTGEIYWEQTGVTNTPTLIEYASPTQSEVPGAEAAGTWSVSLMYLSTSRLMKFNPWTGAVTANITFTNSPALSSATFYAQSSGRGGDPMVLSIQNMGSGNYRLINWTTRGTSTNFTSRIISNTTYARSSLPTLLDFTSGYAAVVTGITGVGGVYSGMNLTGINLWTGATIWSKNISEPVYSGSCDIVDHGKLAVLSDRGYYVCTDLATGNEAWISEKMHYPWTASGFGGYTAMSAYGMLYRESYDGIYAFNWTNGKIVWKYEAPTVSPFETPYTGVNDTGVYPFYSFGVGGQIADGKFYTWTYEHTESWPVTRGWGIHVIDCMTGEGVWNLTGCIQPTAIADGYLVGANSYDGYMYIFGRGQSKTTVTTTPGVIANGATVLIQGSVLDQSPAQPNTPCVSKVSMKTQMEYLHMQLPIDGVYHKDTMTGVDVTLTAIGEDGSVVNIGTATTSAYYGTFEMAWTPPAEGTYKIIASFAGDDSYGSSGAQAAATVGPAPEVTAPVEIPPPTDITPLYYAVAAATVAIIIAVAVVGMMLLRKRQ
jgi:hypothetical protein